MCIMDTLQTGITIISRSLLTNQILGVQTTIILPRRFVFEKVFEMLDRFVGWILVVGDDLLGIRGLQTATANWVRVRGAAHISLHLRRRLYLAFLFFLCFIQVKEPVSGTTSQASAW